MRLYYGDGSRHPAVGHPDEELGLVVGAGIKLNAPMIGQGDFLQAQVNYTQGALKLHLPDAEHELGQE